METPSAKVSNAVTVTLPGLREDKSVGGMT